MSESVGKLNVEVTLQLAKMQAQFDQLTASVRAHNAQIKSEYQQMTGAVKGFFEGMIPTATATGIVAFSQSLIDNASHLQSSAEAVKMGSEDFQVFARLAKDGGLEVDQLTRGLDTMEKKIADAAGGMKAAQAPFADLNIDVKQLATLSPEKQFEMIARSVAGASDQGRAFADAMDILGTRAGPKLLEVLKRVATEGFDVLKQKMESSGLVMTDAVVAKLHELGISEEGFWATVHNHVANDIAAFAAEGGKSVTDLTVQLENAKKALNEMQSGSALGNQMLTEGGSIQAANEKIADLTAQLNKATAAQAKLNEEAGVKAAAAFAPTAAAYQKVIDQQNFIASLHGQGWDAVTVSLTQYQKEIDATFNSLQTLAMPKTIGGATFGDLSGPSEKEIRETADAAKRMFEETRDPIEQYEAKLQQIDALLEQHAIDADTAGRAELKAWEDYQKQIDKTSASLKEEKEMHKEITKVANEAASKISSTFVDGIARGETFRQTLKNIALDLEKMAIQALLFKPLQASLEGLMGGGVSLLSGLIGGAKASGGPVSAGVPYLVGEQGPEIVVPSSNGSVIPNGAIGGGGDTFHQTFNFASGVTARDLAAILPGLTRQIQGAMVDRVRRGGPTAQVFGTA